MSQATGYEAFVPPGAKNSYLKYYHDILNDWVAFLNTQPGWLFHPSDISSRHSAICPILEFKMYPLHPLKVRKNLGKIQLEIPDFVTEFQVKILIIVKYVN